MELVLVCACLGILGLTLICHGQLKRIRRLENAIQFLAQKTLDRIDGKVRPLSEIREQRAKDRELLAKLAGQ